MARMKIRVGGTVLLALWLLACGASAKIGGKVAEDNIKVTVEYISAVPEIEASPTPEPEATTNEAEIEEENEAIEAVETATPEVSGPQSESLPVSSLQDSLAQLDSLQAEYRFRVESTAGFVSGRVQIEETRSPRALHLVMASQSSIPGSENNPQNLEIYAVTQGDGGTTMYMQNPQDQSWLAIAVGDVSAAYDILPIALDALDTLPPQGLLVGQENVNNVPANHFSYTHNDFGDAATLDEAQGDIWIAAEQNLVMRLIQRVRGGNTSVLKDTSNQITTYEMSFDLIRFNDSAIVITPPVQPVAMQP